MSLQRCGTLDDGERLSCVEVYNNLVYDLLQKEHTGSKCNMRATTKIINSCDGAMKLITSAKKRRIVAAIKMNAKRSSVPACQW